MSIEKIRINELTPDDINANKGTQRGTGMLEKSLRKYGAGRSVVVDKDNRIIAGNKTVEAAGSIGLENAIVVDSDGTEIIVVRRTDLDLDSAEGRGLALADNRVGEVNLEWDTDALKDLMGNDADVAEFFTDIELKNLLGDYEEVNDPLEERKGMPEFEQDDLNPTRQVIVSFRDEKAVQDFAELVGSKISPKTKSIWYPHQEWDSTIDHVWVGDEK